MQARLIIGVLAVVFSLELVAAPSMFKERRRMDRLEMAEDRWKEPERVTLNIHYRVPVVETLGYLAAFYNDPQKLTTVSADLRPIAARVEALSGDSFEGRSFPPEVNAECQRLRTEMFGYVKEVYGDDAVKRIERYLKLKYDKLTSGPFSPVLD
ncbi:MAG: hypothetical protein AAFX93_00990 [Verrucomicrobiota bacterium]